jgi:transposase
MYAHPQIPGIGPVVATAIVAAIGNGAAFCKGREFAAWLGIVPRQYSTGGKAKLLGISKRGNVYLRKILIHGARAAVLRIKRDQAPIGAWLDALDSRAPKNVVVVATANKLAHRLGCALQRQRLQTCRHLTVRKRRLRLGSRYALPLSRTTTTN